MSVQQLVFDILGRAEGAKKAFDDIESSADSNFGKIKASGAKAMETLFSPKTAAALGAAAGAAAMVGLNNAMELGSATRQMTAGLGLDPEQSKAAGGAAGSLYAEGFGESASDVGAATEAVVGSIAGMRDASESDIAAVTKDVMNMATAFEVDAGEAATTAGSLIKNGLASDAGEAADLLVGSMQKVPKSLQGEILPVMDEYGKSFAQLGIDGNTAMGIIVASSADGAIGMDKMGDALKEFTIRGTDMSKATTDAYKSMGLNSEEMTNSLLAGGDTAEGAMAQIVHGLQSIEDPGEQAAAAVALFGTPLEDLGTDQIPNFLGMIDPAGDAFDSLAGSAETMGETLNTGPGVALKQLGRTVETELGNAAAGLLPMLTPLIENLAQFAPIIVPLVAAMAALAGVIAIVNVVMAMSPITWIIVGIVALVAALALLIMNWDAVVSWLSTVWGGFINWMTGVMGGFVNWWNGLWAGIGAWIQQVWGGFINWITTTWGGFINWLMGLGATISTWWNGLWAGIATWVQLKWNNIRVSIMQAFANVLMFIMATGKNISSFLSDTWSGLISGVSGFVGNVLQFFRDLPVQILRIVSGAGRWLWDTGKSIVQGLIDGISSLAGSIGRFFLNLLPDWIVGPFKIALGINSPSKVFAGYGKNIGEGLINGLSDMESEIDGRMSRLVEVPQTPEPVFGRAPAPAQQGGTQVVEKHITFAPVFEIHGNDAAEIEARIFSRLRSSAAREGLDVGQL